MTAALAGAGVTRDAGIVLADELRLGLREIGRASCRERVFVGV